VPAGDRRDHTERGEPENGQRWRVEKDTRTAAAPTNATAGHDKDRATSPSIIGRSLPRSLRRQTITNPAVTSTAAAHAGNILDANTPPLTCSWPRTSRFVRFEPGNSSDAALTMNRVP
jgi:hypothetical protein